MIKQLLWEVCASKMRLSEV